MFLIDVQQRQKIWEQAFSSFSKNTLVLQWSADNQRILVTGEKQRYVQELIPGGKQIIWPSPTQFQSLPPPSQGDTRGVKVAFSPDRSLQAIAYPTASTSVGIFDIHENRFIAACGTSQSYTSYDQLEMAWAPDGTSLAVYIGSTSETRFSSLPTLQVYRISDGHLLWRSTIANPGDNDGNRSGHIKWSPDNATIACTYTTSLTTYRTTLTVVDVKTGATRFQTDMASFDQRVPPALTGRPLPGPLMAPASLFSHWKRDNQWFRSGTPIAVNISLPASVFWGCR
ncbi:hypothetical protein [Ktedonobacter sp. SOSP1-52]|uniref:hypothetical protein n=1 Tax=Ktedonobacter sp. SOSP1-52 TaxID=2778366 RepID=UPI001F2B1C37|nr:hypothetical protein [Ktedonobacter sp. SOSP1-52]